MDFIGSLTLLYLYCSDGEVISSQSRLIGACQTTSVTLNVTLSLGPMLEFLAVLRHGAAAH